MRLRLLIEWCAITAITLAIIAGLQVSRASERVDNVVYDLFVGLRAPPASDRIMLVMIDDDSIARLGQWPWPRSVHARMLERLAAARPAAIAYDVFFTEPTAAADDERLAQAMRRLGNVALPVLFQMPGLNGSPIDAKPPIAPLSHAAHALGSVALFPDSEGVARSVPLLVTAGGQAWPHLMEQTYRIAQGVDSPVYRTLQDHGALTARVPFQPDSGAFRSVSFASVLDGEVPPEFLENRILLVGMAAAGQGDRFRVPTLTGGLISGIEVQANLLNSLLAGRVVAIPSPAASLLLALLPALALLVSFWWLPPNRALLASVATIGLSLAIPLGLLVFADLWLPPTAALVGLLVAYPLWGWRRLQVVDREIGHELAAFAAEPARVPMTPAGGYLDPVGGHTAQLRAAIADMRDLRRLVSDTIDGVDDPLLVTDLDDRVILTNRTADDLFGETAQDSRSRPLLAALAGYDVAFEGAAGEIRLDDGRTFSPRRFPLRNHAGEQRGWIVHLVDISDIRRAQREREDALEFLSHDMRAPQTAIITLLEHYRQAITDRGLAERIVALARKTLDLSDTFVQLARLDVAPFVPEDVNLADVVTEAADSLWPLASRRNVRIAIHGAEEAHFIEGERDTLGRAVINLLHNAITFSPDDGVVDCTIRAIDGGLIECAIEDRGPGVPPERQADLFARYGHRDARGGRSSSGLGLSYVGATVERHGGTIVHEPRAPHGTRFVLRFTAAE